MRLQKEIESIDEKIIKIKEKLNQLYFRIEKSDFETKSYIFDIFNNLKDIEKINYLLKKDFRYYNKIGNE